MKKKVAVGASLLAVLLTLPTTASFAATQKGKSPEPVVTSLSVFSTVGPMLKLTGHNFGTLSNYGIQDQVAIFSSGVKGNGPFFHLGYPHDPVNSYGEVLYFWTPTSIILAPLERDHQKAPDFPNGDHLEVLVKNPQTGEVGRFQFIFETATPATPVKPQPSVIPNVIAKTIKSCGTSCKLAALNVALTAAKHTGVAAILSKMEYYYKVGLSAYQVVQAAAPFFPGNNAKLDETIVIATEIDANNLEYPPNERSGVGLNGENVVMDLDPNETYSYTLKEYIAEIGWPEYIAQVIGPVSGQVSGQVSGSTQAQQDLIFSSNPDDNVSTLRIEQVGQLVDAVGNLLSNAGDSALFF